MVQSRKGRERHGEAACRRVAAMGYVCGCRGTAVNNEILPSLCCLFNKTVGKTKALLKRKVKTTSSEFSLAALPLGCSRW